MKAFSTLALLAALFAACSSQNDTVHPKGSGGDAGKGGATGTGGLSASGGSSATGGTSATGGGSGSGGTSATGGRAGTGGAGGRGGAAGTDATGGHGAGGSTSLGGSTGAGGLQGSGGGTTADAGDKDAIALSDAGDAIGPADAASGAHNDAGSSADAASYSPCPTNGDPCKIMPFGDSITWGVGDENNGGYRGPLFALAVAAQQKITFTGSLSNGPSTVSGQPFPQKNEGHSGWTIDQDAGRVPSPAFDNASGGIPNIVLLMIGTNDVYASSGQSDMANRLGSLLDKIISGAPNALVVVAKITPMTIGGGYLSVVTPYNDAIPGLVQTRTANGKHIVMADMNTNFNTSTMLGSDGLHPNTTGYKFMADHWYSVIGNLLPK
jgi:lysophospholipase L1-like esterase